MSADMGTPVSRRIGDIPELMRLETSLISLLHLTGIFNEYVEDNFECERGTDHKIVRDQFGYVRIKVPYIEYQRLAFMHEHLADVAKIAFERLEQFQERAGCFVYNDGAAK